MAGESYLWIKAIHVFGFILWTGSLLALANMLRGNAEASEAGFADLVRIERRAAMVMDMGAMLAIASGLAMILQTRNAGDAWVMKHGWMHIKLTLVVAVLAGHGYVRVKVGKARRGDRGGIGAAVPMILGLLVLAIAIVAVARPIGA